MRGADKFFPDYDKNARRLLRRFKPFESSGADDLQARFKLLTVQSGGTVQTSAPKGA